MVINKWVLKLLLLMFFTLGLSTGIIICMLFSGVPDKIEKKRKKYFRAGQLNMLGYLLEIAEDDQDENEKTT